jgi:hypothetical protein
MADLPDLDTENIGLVCYYNAEANGVQSIEPTSCLDEESLIEYTAYDNGWDGKMRMINQDGFQTGPFFRVRVKSDGWMIAYTPLRDDEAWRTEPTERTSSEMTGPWTAVTNRYDPSGFEEPAWSNYTMGIKRLANSLNESGNINFNRTDVSFYDYSYPDASGVSTGWMRGQDSAMEIQVGTQTTMYNLWGFRNPRWAGNINVNLAGGPSASFSNTVDGYIIVDVADTPYMPSGGDTVTFNTQEYEVVVFTGVWG